MKNWMPAIVLLVAITAQWSTVFYKMLDMQTEITTVKMLISQHLKKEAPEIIEKRKTGGIVGRVSLAELKYGLPAK